MSWSQKVNALAPLLKPPRERDKVLQYQQKRVRELVRHAYHHVQYYRELFDAASVDPGTVVSLRDIRRIPTSTKEDLQVLPVEMLVDRRLSPDRLLCRQTTGSSGQPFKVRCSWFEDRLLSVYALKERSAYGIGLAAQTAKVKIVGPGSSLPLTMRMLSRFGILRTRLIDSLQEPEMVRKALRDFQPDVIVGYPGFLSYLASEPEDLQRHGIRPRLLIVGGETMTAAMRRQMEAGFRARVFETYGSHEFNVIASECPETGLLHVNERSVLLEVLNEGDEEVEEGEGGETVITGLHSFAQPFIRFRLGDWVLRGPTPCPCGVPYATLKRVEGRKMDRIKLPGGRSIPSERLCMVLSAMPWVRHYQIIQEDEENLLLKVVPFRPLGKREEEQLARALADFVGSDLQTRYEVVEHIPLGPAGKFQLSRSAV